MITIKVKQEPSPDWPDGWAEFAYEDTGRGLVIALEHWETLREHKSDAVWKDKFNTKTLEDGREV